MLSKIRHYVPNNTLRTIYHGIFSSILIYGSQIWGQIQNKNINRIIKLQDKAIRIINFAHYRESTTRLYKKSNILKFNDNIKLLNFMYVHQSMNGYLPSALNNNFIYLHNLHGYNTRSSSQFQVKLPKINTQVYGYKNITYQSATTWNYFLKKIPDIQLYRHPKSYCKRFIIQFFINGYQP